MKKEGNKNKKSKDKILMCVFFVVIIGVFGIVTYFFKQYQELKKPIKEYWEQK